MYRRSFYNAYIKRAIDFICALLIIILFSWVFLIVALFVRFNLGAPVIFKQPRPGMKKKNEEERIFLMYKFRTMSNERDENGKLLPDEKRMGKFGKFLRASSLDELPETFNILKGEMSLVGPRPQLVKDMVFMTKEQRARHSVRPGLTGLAQVNGRNAISWEEKLKWDLQYINCISFKNDLKIIFLTAGKIIHFPNHPDNQKETDVTLDYGDELLRDGKVSFEQYKELQIQAQQIVNEFEEGMK